MKRTATPFKLSKMGYKPTPSDKNDKEQPMNKKKPTDEVMSQEEVEDFLNIMCHPNAPEPPKSNEKKEEDTTERIGRKQMRILQLMHEKLARMFTVRLCKMLQACVEVKLTSINQLVYSEFVFSCDNPTCFNLIQIKSPHGDGSMVLDINPSICFPMNSTGAL